MDNLGHVLVRSDLNVPIGKSTNDDYRIKRSTEILSVLKNRSKTVTFLTHLGRPNTYDETFSTKQLVSLLEKYTKSKVHFIPTVFGNEVDEAIKESRDSFVYLLENIRFYEGELLNDSKFAKNISIPFDTYIFDAFGASHREHASVTKIGKYLQTFQGPLIDREIKALDTISQSGSSGITVLLGGSKISDKISVIKNLLPKVENLLLGGGMVFTFLKAMDKNIGHSVYEESLINDCRKLIDDKLFKKIILPVDIGVTTSIKSGLRKDVSVENIGDEDIGVDIGRKSIAMFSQYIDKSRVIFWNGPMGIFEESEYSQGTYEVAKLIESCKAYTVVGGGDTISALRQFSDIDKIDYLSTGGGASLKYLEGNELPGVNKYPSLII